MPKEAVIDPFHRNFQVTVTYGLGDIQMHYLFFRHTKREIMDYLAEHKIIGEATETIEFHEIEAITQNIFQLQTHRQEIISDE
jgi:hypothetical protein